MVLGLRGFLAELSHDWYKTNSFVSGDKFVSVQKKSKYRKKRYRRKRWGIKLYILKNRYRSWQRNQAFLQKWFSGIGYYDFWRRYKIWKRANLFLQKRKTVQTFWIKHYVIFIRLWKHYTKQVFKDQLKYFRPISRKCNGKTYKQLFRKWRGSLHDFTSNRSIIKRQKSRWLKLLRVSRRIIKSQKSRKLKQRSVLKGTIKKQKSRRLDQKKAIKRFGIKNNRWKFWKILKNRLRLNFVSTGHINYYFLKYITRKNRWISRRRLKWQKQPALWKIIVAQFKANFFYAAAHTFLPKHGVRKKFLKILMYLLWYRRCNRKNFFKTRALFKLAKGYRARLDSIYLNRFYLKRWNFIGKTQQMRNIKRYVSYYKLFYFNNLTKWPIRNIRKGIWTNLQYNLSDHNQPTLLPNVLYFKGIGSDNYGLPFKIGNYFTKIQINFLQTFSKEILNYGAISDFIRESDNVAYAAFSINRPNWALKVLRKRLLKVARLRNRLSQFRQFVRFYHTTVDNIEEQLSVRLKKIAQSYYYVWKLIHMRRRLRFKTFGFDLAHIRRNHPKIKLNFFYLFKRRFYSVPKKTLFLLKIYLRRLWKSLFLTDCLNKFIKFVDKINYAETLSGAFESAFYIYPKVRLPFNASGGSINQIWGNRFKTILFKKISSYWRWKKEIFKRRKRYWKPFVVYRQTRGIRWWKTHYKKHFRKSLKLFNHLQKKPVKDKLLYLKKSHIRQKLYKKSSFKLISVKKRNLLRQALKHWQLNVIKNTNKLVLPSLFEPDSLKIIYQANPVHMLHRNKLTPKIHNMKKFIQQNGVIPRRTRKFYFQRKVWWKVRSIRKKWVRRIRYLLKDRKLKTVFDRNSKNSNSVKFIYYNKSKDNLNKQKYKIFKCLTK